MTAPIGAGGMGEVFRARDPRLQRDVALKILPDLHPDGTRFAFAASVSDGAATRRDHVVMAFNFFDELRRLAPPKR